MKGKDITNYDVDMFGVVIAGDELDGDFICLNSCSLDLLNIFPGVIEGTYNNLS